MALTNSDLFVVSRGGTNYSVSAQAVAAFAAGGGVTSVAGTGGLTVSPTTGAVVIDGSGKLNLSGGTMTGALITAAGSGTAPSLGIGSATKGFYSSSYGTAYTPGATPGTTLIINTDGQLLLGKATQAAAKTYGGALVQLYGDSTSVGSGGAFTVSQYTSNVAESANISLITGNGSVASPTVRTIGEIGRIQFSENTSTSSLAPKARAMVLGTKSGSGNQSYLQVAVNSNTDASPVSTWNWQSAAFRPTVDNNQVLGTTTFRPQYLCAVSGVINTSDANYKKNVTPLTSTFGLSYVNSLNPVTFQWITEYNNVAKDPSQPDNPNAFTVTPVPGAITHFGFVAQDVYASMAAAGGPTTSNGMVGQHKDLPPAVRDGASASQLNEYWMNHAQVIPPLVKAVQELSDALDTLRAEFDAYVLAHP